MLIHDSGAPSISSGWGYLDLGTPVAREARLFPTIERDSAAS